MEKKWFYIKNDEACGPISWDRIVELYESKKLSNQSKVWSEDYSDWVGLNKVLKSKNIPTPPPVPQKKATPPPLPIKKKVSTPSSKSVNKKGRHIQQKGDEKTAKVLKWSSSVFVSLMVLGAVFFLLNKKYNSSKTPTISFKQWKQSTADFYVAKNGITIKCPNANFGDKGTVNGVTYTKRKANQITIFNAATTCTSGITDMSAMFWGAKSFNQSIGNWDVSNVNSMGAMFFKAKSFNQPIGNWNVSNVEDMSYMFKGASSFNQPIGNWNVSNVNYMVGMFNSAISFNQPIGSWNVSGVRDMEKMFYYAISFRQNISNWCVSFIDEYEERKKFSEGSSLKDTDIPVWGACPH